MASFALEDFVGNGVLQAQLDNLVADGWDDVPTLKMMSYQDMDTLELSQLQRVSTLITAQFNLSNSVSIITIIILK
jgi:hypothetical protein